jgi:predicted CoA-binding protein
MSKKTLVFGASLNTDRISNMAVHQLIEKGHEVVAVGGREGRIGPVSVQKGTPPLLDIHTISLYINPALQAPLYAYFLSLQPARIIFNPGTENPELARLAREKGIEALPACTLVMLSVGLY